jgi:hypothetical protein
MAQKNQQFFPIFACSGISTSLILNVSSRRGHKSRFFSKKAQFVSMGII